MLEFRNERFWSVAPGHVTGCLQVRVRRDANEQAVLSQVAGKLTSFVSPEHLTIQVVKDR